VTLSTDIFIVNGVSYFNLRSANKHVLKIKKTSVEIPGVQLPEPLEYAKITAVYMDQEHMLPEPNGSCQIHILIRSLCCPNQMDLVGIDFDSMIPKAIQAVEANGVRWSTRKSGAICVCINA
jgi:hypothetical protein